MWGWAGMGQTRDSGFGSLVNPESHACPHVTPPITPRDPTDNCLLSLASSTNIPRASDCVHAQTFHREGMLRATHRHESLGC